MPTTNNTGTAGGPLLPEPYPFDPAAGHISMADVAHNIREAVRDASCEVVMEMRMLGHVQEIAPADRQRCLNILEALQQLQNLADQLPR